MKLFRGAFFIKTVTVLFVSGLIVYFIAIPGAAYVFSELQPKSQIVLWQKSVNIPETLVSREFISNCLAGNCTFDLAIPINRETDWNTSDIIVKVDGNIVPNDKFNLTRYGKGEDSPEFVLVRLAETRNGKRSYETKGSVIKVTITG